MGDPTGISRREILSSIGASGLGITISAGVVSGMDEFLEIQTDHINNGENNTEKVPVEWYNEVKRTRRGLNRLAEEYRDSDYVHSVYRRSSDDNMIAGFSSPSIGLKLNEPTASQYSQLPTQVNGVKVEYTQAKERFEDDHTGPSPCWDNASPYDSPKGGSYIATSEGWASAACRVYEGINDYWMTSAHLFENYVQNGEVWYGPNRYDDDYYVGDVNTIGSNSGLDFATISIDDSTGIDDVSRGIHGSEHLVSGHVTPDGISYLIDSSETVYNFGAKTCDTSGSVTGTEFRNGLPRFEVSTNAGSGDSGSPHYRVIEQDGEEVATIIGIHEDHTLDSNNQHHRSYGPLAYEINRVYNIQFGTRGLS